METIEPVKQLTKEDEGRWVIYTGTGEKGRIKSFSNERRIAWVVYKCNKNWDADHWKDYTAESTNYSDLVFFK